jgi:large subunit ribosomal protein L3
MATLMGKKRGMMQLFDDKGNVLVCTVIQAEPNVVTQIKTVETDGYKAIQLGFDKVPGKNDYTVEKRTKQPQLGLFKKVGTAPRRHLCDTKVETTQ